jgi:hypothetical protein
MLAAAPAAEASRGALHVSDVPAGVDSTVAVAVAQQLQSHLLLLLAQQLADHLPPELADIDPQALISLQQAVAGQLEQEQAAGEGEDYSDCDEEEGAEGGQHAGQHGQQQAGVGEAHVPEDVLHYAQQYQQGEHWVESISVAMKVGLGVGGATCRA